MKDNIQLKFLRCP